MNDKIKHILAKAYKTDSVAKNKWRIENREQLREQRKKELKELIEKDKTMSNNKQSMKKLILATLLIGMISSCDEPTVTRQSTEIVTEYGSKPLKLIVIDDCEYFEYSSGHRYSLCHKGNCKNPIHKGGNNE